jgi:hypothetical protein
MNKRSIITTLLLLAMMTGQAQEDNDLLYIFPSKEVYETGEDLWFKAYLMDRQTLALSDRSQTLYLLLRSETGEVVWSEKYPLNDGRGDGHVYIGENWQLGEYHMEGYTRSSFTTDTTYAILPRRILVVNRVAQMDSISAEAMKRDSLERQTAKHRFDLFPEGGNLIDGINAVVAFKATYGNSMPEEVSGIVMEDGHEIATFKSLHDGMGQFTLTPYRGRDYKVQLEDGRTYPLPTIQRTGLALRVTRNNSSGITLLVSAPDTISRPFNILAKMRGMPCCSAQGTVRGQQKVKLPIEKFTLQGIVEITLSEGNKPVAERLVYVNPKQQLKITAHTDHQQYNRRGQGKVSFKVTDPSGQPLKAELAITIFDKACLYLPGHENILSHCFLSEQIRGNIFNPTYYFDERNADRLQALDLLLMTQGWRRYILDDEPIPLTSILSDGVRGQDLAERQQFLQAFTPDSDTLLVMSDAQGRFEITPSQMDQLQGYFYLKPLVKKPKAKLTLENPFDSIAIYQKGHQRYLPQDFFYETNYGDRDVIDALGTIMLKNVDVTGKRRTPYRDRVMEYLDSLAIVASGVWVCDHNGQQWINNYHEYHHHPAHYPYPYTGKRLLPKRGQMYHASIIEEHGGKWWDLICSQPVIYEGARPSEKALMEMFGMWTSQGYYPHMEFYEPAPLDHPSTMPDPRTTLKWVPALPTDDKGKAEIAFLNSDVNTEFMGIVEAIDGSGLLGYQTFTFRVIKNK